MAHEYPQGSADDLVRDAVPRFAVHDPEALAEGMKYLDENGYVVIADVLCPEEIAEAKELLWKFLEGEVNEGIDRNDPETWSDARWPGDPTTGIISRYAAGHSEMNWFVRGKDTVQQVFRKIWKTKDIITSFDGANTFRPWSHNPRWKTSGGWWHVDQNAMRKPGKQAVQGLVSLYDGTPEVGGLAVIPGSHHEFKACAKRMKIRKIRGDFVMITPSDPLLQRRGQLVQCKAGDLVLWDSRTIHCNVPGVDSLQDEKPSCSPAEPSAAERSPAAEAGSADSSTSDAAASAPSEPTDGETVDEELEKRLGRLMSGAPPASAAAEAVSKRVDLIRAVVYVCMTPRKFASSQVLQLRREAAERRISTSHWPHDNLDEGYIRSKYRYTPKLSHTLNDEQKRLI